MTRLLVCANLIVVLAPAANAAAQVLVAEFSEQTIPVNPMNNYGSFTFGDMSVAGAVTDGPDSLIFDLQTDNDGSNGYFGGIGVDFGTPAEISPGNFVLQPLDFDPNNSWWEMRVKILENNAASTVNTTYRDSDSPNGSDAEEYQFNFDLSGIPQDGAFHLITVPTTQIGFSQTSSGTPDGMNNPGLNQIQIQSVFGSSDRLNIEVDYVRIYTIPEPTGVSLIGLFVAAAAGIRKTR